MINRNIRVQDNQLISFNYFAIIFSVNKSRIIIFLYHKSTYLLNIPLEKNKTKKKKINKRNKLWLTQNRANELAPISEQ